MGAHFTSDVLASQNDEQSMKVICAPNVSACFKHRVTMYKQEQSKPHVTITPHMITKQIHQLFPPYAINGKQQKHNKNKLLSNHQANRPYLIIKTKLLLLRSVPWTYENQNKTSLSSEDVSINENWIDNISPTINNWLSGFDCQNPREVDSFELESIDQWEKRIQNSKKRSLRSNIQEFDEYPMTACLCKLIRTKRFHFAKLLILIHHYMIKVYIQKNKG